MRCYTAEARTMSLPHQKLVVWQRADDLFIEIHKLTRETFPKEERYELCSQLRRAAYSVPANIVEGNARETSKEKLRFLSIASSSLAEVGYGLHASRRLGYLAPEVYDAFELKVRQVGAPLSGLMRKHRRDLGDSSHRSSQRAPKARVPRRTE